MRKTERVSACVRAGLAGFAPADRVMDLFIVAYGLRVMYEIHLKFSVSNEALACLRVGEPEANGSRRTCAAVAHSCGRRGC